MARRPTEVALIADILEAPADSVEDLAETVIDALDQDRRKRDSYVVRVSLGTAGTFGLGPFPTRNEARTAARTIHPEISDEELDGCVARLLPPRTLDEPPLSERLRGYCDVCSHPMATHDWPKSKIAGCVIAGCLCGKPTAPPV